MYFNGLYVGWSMGHMVLEWSTAHGHWCACAFTEANVILAETGNSCDNTVPAGKYMRFLVVSVNNNMLRCISYFE